MEATGRTVLYVCSVLGILTGEQCVLCCRDGMLSLSCQCCVGAAIAVTVVAVFTAVALVGRVKLRGEQRKFFFFCAAQYVFTESL